MAEEHRRVEPRSIVGTGMASDPERIQSLIDENKHRSRHLLPPERDFSEVIATTPAQPQDLDRPPAPARPRTTTAPPPDPRAKQLHARFASLDDKLAKNKSANAAQNTAQNTPKNPAPK